MKFSYRFFIPLSFFALTGCSDFFNQVVEIEIPEHEPVLAVSAHIKAQDTMLNVFVSRSAGILDPGYLDTVKFENASVSVLRDGQLWMTVPHQGDGQYYLFLGSPVGDASHSYTLQVTAPGFEPVEATQTMPAPVGILNAEYKAEGGVNPDGNRVNTLDLEFQDPAGEDNYYLLEAYAVVVDSFSGNYEYFLQINTEDALVEEYNGGLIFRDGPLDGKKYTLKTYFSDNLHEQPGSRLAIRLRSISRDRYLFLRTLDLYGNAQNNPFAEPVVVHNNIEGGVGIFTVESRDVEVIEF